MHIDSSWKNYEYIRDRDKPYFGPTTCNMATYACRVKKQYMRIVFETNKLRQLFNQIFEKFFEKLLTTWNSILHWERKRKGTSYRLHKCSARDREASMIHQWKYLSPDDVRMLEQGNEIIQKKYLKENSTRHRTKRFFRFSHLVIRLGIVQKCKKVSATLKGMYRPLYNQNILQEKQIIELNSLFECDLWTCPLPTEW